MMTGICAFIWNFAGDALKKLEERGVVLRFVIGRRFSLKLKLDLKYEYLVLLFSFVFSFVVVLVDARAKESCSFFFFFSRFSFLLFLVMLFYIIRIPAVSWTCSRCVSLIYKLSFRHLSHSSWFVCIFLLS